MVAGLAALGTWLATGIGPGAGPSVSVTLNDRSPLRIDCPDLDTESRAAFETRARAELALSPQPAGEIAVACELNAAHVGWRAANGRSAQRDVGLNSDAATVVDSLLVAVHALRTGNLTSPPARASGIGSAPLAPDPVAVVVARPEHVRASGLRVGVEAGVYGEVWEGSVAGGLEGLAGLRFDTRSRWELSVTGGFGRGVQPSAGVHARTMSAMIGVAHIPVRNLEVEAGVLWRSLTATREVFDGPSERTASTVGLFAAIRYVLARGRLALAVGPHLSLLEGPMVVDVAGTEVFRVPRFVTGLSLGGRVDFNR